jgi:hypothetical protein
MTAIGGGAEVTFHVKGLMALTAFVAVLLIALETPYGPLALAAGLVIELLLWAGFFGFGRAPGAKPPR